MKTNRITWCFVLIKKKKVTKKREIIRSYTYDYKKLHSYYYQLEGDFIHFSGFCLINLHRDLLKKPINKYSENYL